MVGTFQRVSAKGLVSCSSLSGFSPQEERRLLFWEGKGHSYRGEAGRKRRLTSTSSFHIGVKSPRVSC